MFRKTDQRHDDRTRRVGAITASAAAAIALTAGLAAPATAAPAPAAEAGAQQTDGRLEAAIQQAKAEGHISDDNWVADPNFEIARGEHTDASAQVITIAGGTGSSPQAVLLYSPGHGKYVTTAPVPERVAGDARWGDRVGNVKLMNLTTPDKDIGVLWTTPDGKSADTAYRFQNDTFEMIRGG